MLSPTHTQIIKISPDVISQYDNQYLIDNYFKYPIQLLEEGNVVSFPTETVYGLGANALNGNAARKIFEVKKRPMDNPLIVHVSSIDMLKEVVSDIPEEAQLLMDAFWPGPLTILFPKSDKVPDEVVCGLSTVAVRMPKHPIARKLIELANMPIAAPSANLSGRPSPTTAIHVWHDLNGRCSCIIDGGDCNIGLESTVVDIKKKMILRPGGITLEQLREHIPDFKLFNKDNDTDKLIEKPPTPGLKYRHYTPDAKVILIECSPENMERKLIDITNNSMAEHEKIGIIHTHDNVFKLPDNITKNNKITMITVLGDLDHPEIVARGLFKSLRDMEEAGVSLIIMEGIKEENEGLAVMNRIRKAASVIKTEESI